ncbi:hypothetical protein ARALYDRAFT_893755 [Arabidopsis lyrata subsp. lyrata]|uniref:Uncharacterized protein n=1 Tax=Arabidopsis lyrata subsp. lyrata TaxID=81972 RepID=D7KYN5_ARALL|nr:hypothetical protein ARALYDRAFT_893755 [Arabidopsis lyrata subsp. lyrata]
MYACDSNRSLRQRNLSLVARALRLARVLSFVTSRNLASSYFTVASPNCSGYGSVGSDLVAAIHTIEADGTVSAEQKAKKRQQLI